MQNLSILKIPDDSGFIAIVNADKYNSFVSKEWQLPQLINRFVDEMNNNNLIIWSTGSENTWNISIVNKPSGKKPFREFSKSITVTGGQLFFTNYEELTMSAQYDDEKIPSKQNADLSIRLENGVYDLNIRQLFNPEDYQHQTKSDVNFEIVVQATAKAKHQQVDKIFWWT